MAKSKSLDVLKVERATLRRLFSCLANGIARTRMEMSMEELQENFKKLTLEGSRVLEAAYIAAGELSNLQRADIEKTE